MSEFRSFRDQSLHYFMREHTEIPVGPIDSPAAWRGDDMRAHQTDWLNILSPAELDEIEQAAGRAIAAGLDMSAVSKGS